MFYPPIKPSHVRYINLILMFLGFIFLFYDYLSVIYCFFKWMALSAIFTFSTCICILLDIEEDK